MCACTTIHKVAGVYFKQHPLLFAAISQGLEQVINLSIVWTIALANNIIPRTRLLESNLSLGDTVPQRSHLNKPVSRYLGRQNINHSLETRFAASRKILNNLTVQQYQWQYSDYISRQHKSTRLQPVPKIDTYILSNSTEKRQKCGESCCWQEPNIAPWSLSCDLNDFLRDLSTCQRAYKCCALPSPFCGRWRIVCTLTSRQ